MKNGKIGWGIIGPGIIANMFAECLGLLDDAYIAAAGSRNIKRAEDFCERWGGKAYGSYDEVYNDPDVDIVYIAVPHPQHVDQVKAAAAAGKAILCEKPFSPNYASTESMIQAARDNNVFLMEGLWSRFFPAWQYASQLAQSGELGKIRYIRSVTEWGCKRPGEADPTEDSKAGGALRDDNRLMDPNLAGGMLLDGGVYGVAAMTVASGLLEMPEKMITQMQFTHTGVDARTSVMLKYRNGMTAELCCDLYGLEFGTLIECEKGNIYVPRHRDPDTVIVERALNGRYGVMDREEKYFPFESYGFQFEAAVVQDCFRQGLKECPQVTHKEMLLYAQLCGEIRKRHGFSYPFEK